LRPKNRYADYEAAKIGPGTDPSERNPEDLCLSNTFGHNAATVKRLALEGMPHGINEKDHTKQEKTAYARSLTREGTPAFQKEGSRNAPGKQG